jgi:glycogen debranching enzyme
MLHARPTGYPESIIEVNDEFYILAKSTLLDDRTRVIKHDDSFAVFDRYGDIRVTGHGEQGLYHDGTRYLSRLVLTIDGYRPLLLSSTSKSDNGLVAADLTNTDLRVDHHMVLPHGSIHLFRGKFVWQATCYEYLRVRNYSQSAVRVRLAVSFDADFADIFEVRGTKRARKGRMLSPEVADGHVVRAYRGLDDVVRRSVIRCSPLPAATTDSGFSFDYALEPRQEEVILFTIDCEREGQSLPKLGYDAAYSQAMQAKTAGRASIAGVTTSHDEVDDWLDRSFVDLQMMVTRTEHGPYPYAGVPWFSTPFGRDGIITAIECLWLYPALAKGVLLFLAATQATDLDPARDAEPGKIIHEMRGGEMAALGEVPFGRYYGSADATPLFVALAGLYYERTGDRSLIERIWPHVVRALEWMDQFGDQDRDGFVEYGRRTPSGLINQGWKDSHDSIFHADGRLAAGPVALVEVQAYVYLAKRKAAGLAAMMGKFATADRLLTEARNLQAAFEDRFWLDDLSTYALALDGDKAPCRVKTSNAGHCLFTGIASAERAERLGATLLGEDHFSGWGVRTVAATEVRYNPMSYHNGSIWPHDNALIAHGLAAVGLTEAANRIFAGLYAASLTMDLRRLPELFCGFHRRPGEAPTQYPVACAPQSWAAAAPFLLLQSCLGLSIKGPEAQVVFDHPVFPSFLESIDLERLAVGEASVDLHLEQFQGDVGIHITNKRGKAQVITVK